MALSSHSTEIKTTALWFTSCVNKSKCQLPFPFLTLQLTALKPFHSSSSWLTIWPCLCLLSKVHYYLPEKNYSYHRQTLCSKTSGGIFSRLLSYLLLTNNILNSLAHPLPNLKNIFLMTLPYNVSRSFPFYFTLDLINFTHGFFRSSFSLLVFTCFYSFHSFHFSLKLLLTPPSPQYVSFCLAGSFCSFRVFICNF